VRRMLTEADREEISPRGIAEHAGGRVIAERMGRDPSVISRDVATSRRSGPVPGDGGGAGRRRGRRSGRGCASNPRLP